jgi:hypothetical protein
MGAKFVKITAASLEQLTALPELYELDVFRQTARQLVGGTYTVDALLSEAEIDRLQTAGYGVEIVSDADQVAKHRGGELHAHHR